MTTIRTNLGNLKESARRTRVEPTGGITATNVQKALEALDTGTLKSLAFAMPAEFSVAGSPTSGGSPSISVTKATQARNLFYAGPGAGADAAPGFRAIVGADISGSFTGITGVGTLNAGTWNAAVIAGSYGGTGVNNGSSTITIGGNVTISGAFNFAGTLTGATAITFPTGGTLVSSSTAAGGDLAGTYPNPTLAAVISAGGPTGSSSVVPVITYDAKGRLTAVSTASITPAAIGATPTTRTLTAAGLVSGGGDLSADRTFTVTASSQAQAEAGTSNTTAMTPLTVAEAIVAQTQKFKNVLGRNGGLEVWQRLVGAASTIAIAASTTAYGADGWYLATGASQASTLSQVAGLVSNSRFAARVQRNSGQTGTGTMRLAFPLDIDELLKMAGRQVVLSFVVSTGADWSPAGGTLSYNLYVGTGAVAKRNASAYTGETSPISGSVNLAQGAAAATKISAVSSAIASNITQAELQLSWVPAGTAGANDWFAIDDVQIEVVLDGVAPAAPLFERSDFVWDLQRCQRFLPAFNVRTAAVQNLAFGLAFGATSGFFTLPFPVATRVRVTGLVVSAAGDWVTTDAGLTSHACTAITFNTGSDTIGAFTTTVASGLTVGQGIAFGSGANTAQFLWTGAEI